MKFYEARVRSIKLHYAQMMERHPNRTMHFVREEAKQLKAAKELLRRPDQKRKRSK